MNIYCYKTGAFLRKATDTEISRYLEMYESLIPPLQGTGVVPGDDFGFNFSIFMI